MCSLQCHNGLVEAEFTAMYMLARGWEQGVQGVHGQVHPHYSSFKFAKDIFKEFVTCKVERSDHFGSF